MDLFTLDNYSFDYHITTEFFWISYLNWIKGSTLNIGKNRREDSRITKRRNAPVYQTKRGGDWCATSLLALVITVCHHTWCQGSVWIFQIGFCKKTKAGSWHRWWLFGFFGIWRNYAGRRFFICTGVKAFLFTNVIKTLVDVKMQWVIS